MEYSNETLKNGQTIFLSSGSDGIDTANNTTVDEYGSIYASSGGTAYTTVINQFGIAEAYAGGVFSTVQINSGGIQYIDGGSVYDATVANGGAEYAASGTAFDSVVSAGGLLQEGDEQGVKSAGSSVDAMILAGGGEFTLSGGSQYDAVVASAGFDEVAAGGYASGTVVENGGIIVFAGGDQYSGDVSDVLGPNSSVTGSYSKGTETYNYYSAGQLVTQTVSSGGTEKYYSGTTLYETQTQKGNELYTSQVTASGTSVYSALNYTYDAGRGTGIIVSSGGTVVLAGGHVTASFKTGAKVDIGGTLKIDVLGQDSTGMIANVFVSDFTIKKGVQAFVYTANALEASTVSGIDQILSGGISLGNLITSGGEQVVSAGGVASQTLVMDALDFVFGRDNLAILSGTKTSGDKTQGIMVVSSGGIASATDVYFGGDQEISSAGVASNSVVSGGLIYVSSGGILTTATVFGAAPQGTENILVTSGGKASFVTLNAKAKEIVSAGGSAGSTVINSGGFLYVGHISASASATTINAGGTEIISSGGLTTAALVNSGGFEKVSSGGNAVSATINAGGDQTVFSGGKAVSATIKAGGFEYVSSGGITTSGSVYGEILVRAGGSALAANLQSGGELILKGGVSSMTLVQKDGDEVISQGGISYSAHVVGKQQISAGGVAISSLLYSGGQAVIYAGGVASAAEAKQSGRINVSAGGSTVSSIILSNGKETVFSGGTAKLSNVETAGTEVISSGGTLAGASFIGGTIELAAGAQTTGAIDFDETKGDLLIIDGTAMPSATIDDFGSGNSIQLAGVTYNTSDTVNVVANGEVKITAGTQSYTLNIAGATIGETDFSFGPNSLLTRNAAEMTFLKPPASPSAGFAGAFPPTAILAAADFVSKPSMGLAPVSSGHAGALYAQETLAIPTVVPVSSSLF